MTNREKYAKELLDVLCKTADHPALIDGKPVPCEIGYCLSDKCGFGGNPYGCNGAFLRWVNKECEDSRTVKKERGKHDKQRKKRK